MALAPYTPSYWQARAAADAINLNPTFGTYSVTPGVPDGWLDAGNASGATQQVGLVSAYAMRLVGGAAANAGITQNLNVGIWPGAGWYVMEVVAKLVSGALTAAGSWVDCFTDNGHGTSTETIGTINLATTPDVNGTVNGAGTVGNTYRWRLLVQAKKQTSLAAILYAWSHQAGLGSTAGANSIDWGECLVRPASYAEIAAGNQVQSFPVFPLLPGRTPEIEKAPVWSTTIAEAASGRERRTPQWSYPRWRHSIAYDVIRQKPTNDELAGLLEFFNNAQGMQASFLYLDETDYVEVAAPIGTGDGTTTAFQIQRSIRTWAEPVFAPFGISVYDNGVLKVGGGTDYTLGNLGAITFTSAPANGHALTWDGYFFFLTRFDQDELPIKQMIRQLWGSGLKLFSVKS